MGMLQGALLTSSLSGDPIVATIRQAAGHVLGRVEVIRRDASHLQKKTGMLPSEEARYASTHVRWRAATSDPVTHVAVSRLWKRRRTRPRFQRRWVYFDA